MATIIVLKHKITGKEKAKYSADARELMKQDPNWQFERRLGRTAKMVESGVAAQAADGDSKAVEFHGEAVLQEDARKAVTPTLPDPINADAGGGVPVDVVSVPSPVNATAENDKTSTKDETPQAPRGSRGGGKQEPAKGKSDGK